MDCLGVILTIVFFVALGVYSIHRSCKNDKIKAAANDLLAQSAVDAEKLLPKSYVKVTALDGVEEFFTDKFEPWGYYSEYSKMIRMTTSEMYAEGYVERSYKLGFFEFGSVSIPTAQVKSVEIMKE